MALACEPTVVADILFFPNIIRKKFHCYPEQEPNSPHMESFFIVEDYLQEIDRRGMISYWFEPVFLFLEAYVGCAEIG